MRAVVQRGGCVGWLGCWERRKRVRFEEMIGLGEQQREHVLLQVGVGSRSREEAGKDISFMVLMVAVSRKSEVRSEMSACPPARVITS